MSDLSKLSDEELAAAIRQALQDQSHAQTSHEAKPVREPDIYRNTVSGMSGFDRFTAARGGEAYGAYLGLKGLIPGLDTEQDQEEHRKAMAALRETPGGMAGSLFGGVNVFAPTAMIPGAQTAIGGPLIAGAASYALTPGSAQERAQAALMSAGGAGAVNTLGAGIRAANAAARPLSETGRRRIVGDMLNKVVGEDSYPDVLKNLQRASPLLPGSERSAAEVANSGGIAAVQRWAAQADPEAYANQLTRKKDAIRQAIQGIGKGESEMEAAKQARDQAAEVLYGKAFQSDAQRLQAAQQAANAKRNLQTGGFGGVGNAPIQLDPRIASMADNPIIQSAAKEAVTLAKSQGKNIGNPMESLEGLHYMKLAIDSRLSGKVANTALARHSDAAVVSTKKALLNAIEGTTNNPGISPTYGAARKTFADMSRPINQMQVGQTLEDTLFNPLSDFGGQGMTPNKFATALRQGDNTARKATGMRQGLDQVMEPDQMSTLNAIGQDLAGLDNANNLGRGVGSNTFQNLAMDNLSQSVGMPRVMSAIGGALPFIKPGAQVIRSGLGKIYEGSDEAMRQLLAKALLNPKETASIMEAAKNPNLLAKALQKLPANKRESALQVIQSLPGVTAAGAAYGMQQ